MVAEFGVICREEDELKDHIASTELESDLENASNGIKRFEIPP